MDDEDRKKHFKVEGKFGIQDSRQEDVTLPSNTDTSIAIGWSKQDAAVR